MSENDVTYCILLRWISETTVLTEESQEFGAQRLQLSKQFVMSVKLLFQTVNPVRKNQ